MTRNEAIAAGLTTYLTGKPCKNGHDCPRYTSCGVCIRCLRESAANSARLRNTALATRGTGLALFTYKLHPDDHAAALAFCQALDLQRGRMPQAGEAITAPVVADTRPVELPEWLQRRRAGLAASPPGLESPPASSNPILDRLMAGGKT